MSGQHPLDKLSAAVDGELDHNSRDKVFSHLVGCDSCRAEADAQRRLKAQLGTLDCPEPSDDLMLRLLGVRSFSTEPREEVRPVVTPAVTLSPSRSVFPAGAQSRSSLSRPAQNRPAARAASGRSRKRGVVLGAAGSAAAVASLLGTAFVIGDPAQPPMLQPPVSSFSVDHASTMNGYPFGDTAAMLPAFNGTAFNGAGIASTGSTLVQPVATAGR